VEYVRPDDIDLPRGAELSLLDLLRVETFGLVEHTEAITTHCSSSSSSASSISNAGQAMTGLSSTASQLDGSGSSGLSQDTTSLDEGPTQQLKGQKNSGKSKASNSPSAFKFRCIHNAIAPQIFCINENTLDKFSTCLGAGWGSIAHLKDHMKTHHTKKVRKPNPLQCPNCQMMFPTVEDLTCHTLEVECPICCPDCPEIFGTKVSRTEHRKLSHIEEEKAVYFMEIDERSSILGLPKSN